MLVTVTGGSGFVGAHSIAEIVRKGHRVRLLVRDSARVGRALAPLGVDLSATETVRGDVTDPASVARAMRGAEAVLHAASVYSFDVRDRARIRRTNASGTAVVLEAAVRAGVERIVHVSTVAALFPSPHHPVGAQSPVGSPREAYMQSKADAERVARGWQAQGAPVAISYPPALLGPHDPRLGDQSARLRALLRGRMPIWPSGGFPVGDVRDTAALHAALIDRAAGTGADRLFGPSRYLSTRQYLAAVRSVTGRPLPAAFLPARMMLPIGRANDLIQRVCPWHLPAEYGAVYTCACATRVDADADTGGFTPRPVVETVADTVRWLHAEGLLTARQAGRPGRPATDGRTAAVPGKANR